MDLQITQPGNTEAAILARLIQSRTEMDSQVARYLLAFAFEPTDLERMNLLAERAREGNISRGEETELDGYLHVGNLLTIRQSNARVYLKTHESSASHS
jgi:hypothetical protein